VDKDPRLVEVILAESRRVVRKRPGVLIVEHRLGFIMANAGVDRSNIEADIAAEPVLLLPRDPDASARRLHEQLAAHFGNRLGVIISDSWGRAWRQGTVGVALGVAGLPALPGCGGGSLSSLVVSLNHADSAAAVKAGDTPSFTLSIVNSGPQAASGVSATSAARDAPRDPVRRIAVTPRGR